MTRDDVIPYVSYWCDDAGSAGPLVPGTPIPPEAILVGWQCGFEPMVVAVWSYMNGIQIDDMHEAIELASDYLIEIKWLDETDLQQPDFIL